MIEAILKAPLSVFLDEIEPGTWIPLGIFILHDISLQSKMILDLIYGYSKPLGRAYTKSKGRKEEIIGRIFK